MANGDAQQDGQHRNDGQQGVIGKCRRARLEVFAQEASDGENHGFDDIDVKLFQTAYLIFGNPPNVVSDEVDGPCQPRMDAFT